MSRLWQTSPQGTVRSTALGTRLRTCPIPRTFFTSTKVTSMLHRAA